MVKFDFSTEQKPFLKILLDLHSNFKPSAFVEHLNQNSLQIVVEN